MNVCVGASVLGGEGRGSGAERRDDYQPSSLGSCFLSADVAPVIQLARLASDCGATGSLVGQPGSAAAQQRHPVERG